jgi:YVTN family beta-propeller protein
MTQINLLQLAQAGDADAIAALMNASLQLIGVSARAVLRDGKLHILLESERLLAPSPSVEFIQRGIARLGLGWLSSAIVYSRQIGHNDPAWIQQISLQQPRFVANPFVLDPRARLEAPNRQRWISLLPQMDRANSLNLALLLSLPLVFVLSTSLIWFRYLWGEGAVSSLPFGGNATTQIESSRSKAEKEEPIAAAMEQAKQADRVGKTANSKQEWHRAADHWSQAIAILQGVPASHPKAAIAQQKLTEYQGYLDSVVQDKLSSTGMALVKTITGSISPKSVVHSGKGLFFAQNMMYNHSITVYDRQFNLVKTIPDDIKLSDYGYSQYPGTQHGAPVEAAFSPDGNTAWVSNYQMYGETFSSAADDDCSPEQNHPPSFLYRIGTQNLAIDHVIQVGSVPKYVETTPNHQYVLASNWCSWDVSVVDPQQNKEIRRIQLGPYPRGIAIDRQSETAYVAIMGSYDIAAINLKDFSVDWLRDIGHSPRHVNLDPAGKYLYATLNGEGQIAKIDLATKTVVSKIATGSAPRSMAISGNGQFLYVVNYDSDTISKVRTSDMQVMQSISVNSAPIGITYDNDTQQVWVASYSGSIQVFQD